MSRDITRDDGTTKQQRGGGGLPILFFNQRRGRKHHRTHRTAAVSTTTAVVYLASVLPYVQSRTSFLSYTPTSPAAKQRNESSSRPRSNNTKNSRTHTTYQVDFRRNPPSHSSCFLLSSNVWQGRLHLFIFCTTGYMIVPAEIRRKPRSHSTCLCCFFGGGGYMARSTHHHTLPAVGVNCRVFHECASPQLLRLKRLSELLGRGLLRGRWEKKNEQREENTSARNDIANDKRRTKATTKTKTETKTKELRSTTTTNYNDQRQLPSDQ